MYGYGYIIVWIGSGFLRYFSGSSICPSYQNAFWFPFRFLILNCPHEQSIEGNIFGDKRYNKYCIHFQVKFNVRTPPSPIFYFAVRDFACRLGNT